MQTIFYILHLLKVFSVPGLYTVIGRAQQRKEQNIKGRHLKFVLEARTYFTHNNRDNKNHLPVLNIQMYLTKQHFL